MKRSWRLHSRRLLQPRPRPRGASGRCCLSDSGRHRRGSSWGDRLLLGRAWLDSWVDSPWSHGSYAAFSPGQITRFWGTLGRQAGPIHMAGEQTSTFRQRYLSGGVESGCRAATEILEAHAILLPETLENVNRRAREYLPRVPYDAGA